MDNGKQLLMTMTGEIHQPVRLYYQVFDQAAMLKAFTKLRCMDDDQDNHRWVWLYHGGSKDTEASHLVRGDPKKHASDCPGGVTLHLCEGHDARCPVMGTRNPSHGVF